MRPRNLDRLRLESRGAVLRPYLWGLDLSGTWQGAGGVGGLLEVNDAANGVHFPCYDGNGNVIALVNAAYGNATTRYEYGPFGELLRATGPMAAANHLRWSTKYTDDETDLVCYGYRYYSPSLGRWLSRDPMGERAGKNLYLMCSNHPTTSLDPTGLDDGCTDLTFSQPASGHNVPPSITVTLPSRLPAPKNRHEGMGGDSPVDLFFGVFLGNQGEEGFNGYSSTIWESVFANSDLRSYLSNVLSPQARFNARCCKCVTFQANEMDWEETHAWESAGVINKVQAGLAMGTYEIRVPAPTVRVRCNSSRCFASSLLKVEVRDKYTFEGWNNRHLNWLNNYGTPFETSDFNYQYWHEEFPCTKR